jgi:hypothetical protein
MAKFRDILSALVFIPGTAIWLISDRTSTRALDPGTVSSIFLHFVQTNQGNVGISVYDVIPPA